MIMVLVKTKEFLKNMGVKSISEKHDENTPIGNISCHRVDDIFLSWFVGLENELNPYLPNTLEYIDSAIKKDEEFGSNHDYHLHRLYKYKALGSWAITGLNQKETWKKVCYHIKEAACTGDVWTKNKMATSYLDDYIAFCFLAGEYQEGKQEYQRYHGDKSISLKKGNPKEYAYALCLRSLEGAFEDTDFLASGKRVLSNHLTRSWFGRGQIGQSVLWLNIIHWEVSRSASPIEAVLKAYDDMPTITKPF